MFTRLRPYHLLLLLVASASLVSLWRINKRSFYFHYFKVIEEVESRNSHALSSIPNYFESVKALFKAEIIPFLGFLLAVLSFLILPRPERVNDRHRRLPLPYFRLYPAACLPIRAP
ncbi:MAG: hypothetical protein AAGM67_10215 [Bacteroidota bacterium]